MKEKIFVSGSSGFVGRRLVSYLAQAGYEIIAFDFNRASAKKNLAGVRRVKGDLRNFDAVIKSLEGVDAIVHLGAVTADRPVDPLFLFEVNLQGTCNLLEAAARKGIKRFVFASSIAAYGCLADDFCPDYFPVDEEHPCRPAEPYGLSKLLGEELCRAYARRCAMTAVLLRFTWIPHYADFSASPPATKKTLWSKMDAEDGIQGILLSLKSKIQGSKTFNIAPGKNAPGEKSIDLIKKHYPGVKVRKEYFQKDVKAGLFTIEQAERTIGFKPEHELTD